MRKAFKKKIFHACNLRACYLRRNKQATVLFFVASLTFGLKCWSFWSKKDCMLQVNIVNKGGKCSVTDKEARGGSVGKGLPKHHGKERESKRVSLWLWE